MVAKQSPSVEEWQLPTKTISVILSFLPPAMVARCATISKEWHCAARHPNILKRIQVEEAWRTFSHDPMKTESDFGRLCCVTRKGDRVAMGFCDAWYICDVPTGEMRATCEAAALYLYSICLSEGMLIGGDDAGNICGWNIESGVSLFKFRGHTGDVNAIVDMPGMLASGGADSLIKVWKKDGWECEKILKGHRDWVLCLASGRQGEVLISGSIDSTLRMWDVANGSCYRILRGHECGVDCVDVHGQLIVSGSMNSNVRTWDMDTGECLQVMWGHTGGVRCIATDGARIVTGAYDRQVKVWDIQEERYIRNMNVGARVMGVWFDADRLILTTCGGNMWVWNFSEEEGTN